MGAVQGASIDLQQLHACGGECGGDQADAWLRWRAGRKGRGTVYERVRELHARLGRRIRPEDLTQADAERGAVAPPAPVRSHAVASPTLPPGPPPIKAGAPYRAPAVSQPAPAAETAPMRACRVCSCTDEDCRQCVEKTGEPCHWVEADLCSACAPSPSPSKEEPAMPAKLTKPHPLYPRLLAACTERRISRADAIRQMGISTGSWHQLQHGGPVGQRLADKITAWLASASAPTAPATSKAPAKAKPKPASAVSAAKQAEDHGPAPVDLLRGVAQRLGLPIVRAWIIKDDQLCDRYVVVV